MVILHDILYKYNSKRGFCVFVKNRTKTCSFKKKQKNGLFEINPKNPGGFFFVLFEKTCFFLNPGGVAS